MNRPHLVVIDPSVKHPEIDVINHLSLKSPLPITVHFPALFGMATLEAETPPIRGIVLLGSSSSVNDQFPWQKALGEWLIPRLEQKVPTLGICFGHQFIAYLKGGKVDFLFPDKRKHSGFEPISLKRNPLWQGQTLEGSVCVSHREGIVKLPQDSEVIGTRPGVPYEALQYRGLPVWTFQSHPEATLGFLDNMKIPRVSETDLNFGHQVVDFFLAYCNAA